MSVKTTTGIYNDELAVLRVYKVYPLNEDYQEDLMAALEKKDQEYQNLFVLFTKDRDSIGVIHELFLPYGTNECQAIIENGEFAEKNIFSFESREDLLNGILSRMEMLGNEDKTLTKYPDPEGYVKECKEFSLLFSRGKGVAGIVNALGAYQRSGKKNDPRAIEKVIIGSFLNQYPDSYKAVSMIESCSDEFKKLDKRYKGAYKGFNDACAFLNLLRAQEEEKGIPQKEEEQER